MRSACVDTFGDIYRRCGIRVRQDRRFGSGVVRQRSMRQMWSRYRGKVCRCGNVCICRSGLRESGRLVTGVEDPKGIKESYEED